MGGNADGSSSKESRPETSRELKGHFGAKLTARGVAVDSSSDFKGSSMVRKESKGNVLDPSILDMSVEELSQQLLTWSRHDKHAEVYHACSQQGININHMDEFGNTPLMVACQNGHMRVCKILVEHGADVRVVNKKGNTLLHYCFAYGFQEIGQYLLNHGADEYRTNLEGLTCYEGLTRADLEKI
jgi:ankyrin repeat protein